MRKSGQILAVLAVLLFFSSFMGYQSPSYEWDFGDGSPKSYDRKTIHVYDLPGTYTWKMTVALNGDECQKTGQIEIATDSTTEIVVDRSFLNFGAVGGVATSDQKLLISNAGIGTLNWQLVENRSWLTCNPLSGGDFGEVTVSVNAAGLSAGTYSGTIQIIDAMAINSPQNVQVTLRVLGSGAESGPIGVFDTPAAGATVSGNVPVTGWTLDDVEVTKVEIKRNSIPSDPPGAIGADGKVFIGKAYFVNDARSDVEAAYPNYPLNYRAGWGCMVLTNFLPNQGNGDFTLFAYAFDTNGHKKLLGQKLIHCNNASRTKPFGTIDTPKLGEVISGSVYINFAWALTPQPKMIPTDGSTLWVYVDGVPLGHPNYNQYRPDIATLFPGYANSDGAVGVYVIDSTLFENGRHQLAWGMTDNQGAADGISRYFEIRNQGAAASALGEIKTQPSKFGPIRGLSVSSDPINVKKGYSRDAEPEVCSTDSEGYAIVRIKEVERVEIELGEGINSGCLVVGENLRALPLGSTLDIETGTFYWHPGPGFLGEFDFFFVDSQQKMLKKVRITILPKYGRIEAQPSQRLRMEKNGTKFSLQGLAAIECAASVPASGVVGETIQFEGTLTSTDNKISISLSPTSGGVDTVVSAIIGIDGNANEIAAFGMDVTFDPAAFTYVGYSHGTLTSSWGAGLLANDAGGGVVKAGGWGGGNSIPYDSTGTIIEIRFRVIGGSGSRTISISAFTDDIVGMSPSPGSASFNIQ